MKNFWIERRTEKIRAALDAVRGAMVQGASLMLDQVIKDYKANGYKGNNV
jgi:hypothetical protein